MNSLSQLLTEQQVMRIHTEGFGNGVPWVACALMLQPTDWCAACTKSAEMLHATKCRLQYKEKLAIPLCRVQTVVCAALARHRPAGLVTTVHLHG